MACADGSRLTATMVLDATGHARKLVEFDSKFDPGYQVIMTNCTAAAGLALSWVLLQVKFLDAQMCTEAGLNQPSTAAKSGSKMLWHGCAG